VTALCPSTAAEEATSVVGVVGPGGRVGYVSPPIPVTPSLLATLRSDGEEVERRFRFAGPCAEAGCGFWAGTGCGLVDELVADSGPAPVGMPLPHCGIRGTCRWWSQHGARACATCPEVVTDGR
jgi:hypothetical protein